MLPAQRDMAVRALVFFKDLLHLVYETPATGGLATFAQRKAVGRVLAARDRPAPFWSRAGRRRVATIAVEINPGRIEQAELHTAVWDGGRGTVAEYFTLNGHPMEVAGASHHDVIYTRLPVSPAFLRQGSNQIVLLSDTDGHGIEILEPGPALVIPSLE
ncbi:MAG: hypothetical protein ACP5U2_14390 [Bryobacteraceae bacterium]